MTHKSNPILIDEILKYVKFIDDQVLKMGSSQSIFQTGYAEGLSRVSTEIKVIIGEKS